MQGRTTGIRLVFSLPPLSQTYMHSMHIVSRPRPQHSTAPGQRLKACCHRSERGRHSVGEQRGEPSHQAFEQRRQLPSCQDSDRELSQGLLGPVQAGVWNMLRLGRANPHGGHQRHQHTIVGPVVVHGAVHSLCRRVQNLYSRLHHPLKVR